MTKVSDPVLERLGIQCVLESAAPGTLGTRFGGYRWFIDPAQRQLTASPDGADAAVDVGKAARRLLRQRPTWRRRLGIEHLLHLAGPTATLPSPSAQLRALGLAAAAGYCRYLTQFSPLDALAIAYQLAHEEVDPGPVVEVGRNVGWIRVGDRAFMPAAQRYGLWPPADYARRMAMPEFQPRRRVLRLIDAHWIEINSALAPDRLDADTAAVLYTPFNRGHARIPVPASTPTIVAFVCLVAFLGLTIDPTWLANAFVQLDAITDEVLEHIDEFIRAETLTLVPAV